ncbi:hypothetical protein CTAYLR_000729 [Chrysophaeum taylorii]|uniref:rRNA methyltransferase n=1 Tax=Chrysophaeum taylorii TaxID=2483200 RepID=A0AAD7UAY6_9STRA|nr:hypothetical protein CTAYLR_000729 [Chrysophaeum taylorii]
MGKKAKRIDRNDKWYVLAKEQGYRSRAAFKLAQINKEFGILSEKTRLVLDLCAAPGGWSQVAAKCVSRECGVIAVDLLPIRAITGVRTIVGDITSKETHDAVKREVRSMVGKSRSVDVALCDGAPNVGAAYNKDAFVQNEISLLALKCAVECGLSQGAAFVTKVYRGKDYNALSWAFGRLFERVRAFKPPASRAQSAEIFVVCENYLAPRVDPKLLDPKSVFGDLDRPAPSLSVAHPKYGQRRRQRDGYDGELLAPKEATARDFIAAADPGRFLAEHACLTDLPDNTSDEVRDLAADLRLLGRADMRVLLRWRDKHHRKAPAVVVVGPEEEEEEDASVDSEGEVEASIGREKAHLAAVARRDDKRRRRHDAKQRARAAVGITEESAVELEDQEVFAFSAVNQLDTLGQATLEEEEENEATAEKKKKKKSDEKKVQRFAEYETEGARALEIEEQLDGAFEAYLERKGGKEHSRLAKKRKRDAIAAEKMADDLAAADGDVGTYVAQLTDEDRWYSNPIFADLPKTDKEIRKEKRRKAKERREREAEGAPLEVVQEEEGETSPLTPAQREKKEEAERLIRLGVGKVEDIDAPLEVVPPQQELATFDEDDLDDEDAKAETMALATMMLRKSKAKALVDASFNRYAWHDPKDLPEWFTTDERLHYRPQLPIKPELLEEMKRKFQLLASKPIKKVAEARARKRARAQTRLKAAKRKAEAIAENPDMTSAQKLRAVQKAMASKGKIDKPSKVYVVQRKTKSGAISKSTGAKKGSARVKLVDRRLKKDKRALLSKKKKKGPAKKRRASRK